jgi:hypothetical protein
MKTLRLMFALAVMLGVFRRVNRGPDQTLRFRDDPDKHGPLAGGRPLMTSTGRRTDLFASRSAAQLSQGSTPFDLAGPDVFGEPVPHSSLAGARRSGLS